MKPYTFIQISVAKDLLQNDLNLLQFAKLQKIVAINQMRNVCSLSNTKEEHLINVQLTNGILKLGVQQKLMQMETLSVVNGENVILRNVKKTQVKSLNIISNDRFLFKIYIR